jgi:ribosomal protein S18 acetylase RimI-like enzyme
MSVHVRLLRPDESPRYVALRQRMIADSPWAFAASPDDATLDAVQVATLLETKENIVIIAEVANDLVGCVGVVRERAQKFSHRSRVWGFFVEPAHRGQGIGKALLRQAIRMARSWPGVDYVDLAVSENSPEAYALYKSVGFRAWGREPESTELDGKRYDEIYMSLALRRTKA